ncbi:UDP-N-acetylmuramate--L-alanine ligase [Amylibacter sp.]|nr:UDP-N-acetylmuramate--L-alanine ligase [Amylibacter sp.]MDB4248928.1 UDP-N-acetylmuramate--L-alanine ligase [Amylibacter sp.]MDB9817678.1 UDP-N-acetylmuramate--L-alanine ligase [Amylibacter sp.]
MISTTKLPSQLGTIHFIGIGGIGMSGIAEVLINQGYIISGSDLKESLITKRLVKMGAKIQYPQRAENVEDVEVVVISSAIKTGNPELDHARILGLPIVRRAEMLAELMRLKSNVAIAGTHGKTTTTTMIATLLDHGGIDPTVINGGIIHAYGSNARMGTGEWMVVEADESDGTFNKLPATIAVVTNIDPEHMEHYGTFDNLRDAFYQFVSNIPFYGLAICNTDHPEVQSLVGRIDDRKVVTYGFNKQADIRAENLKFKNGCAYFDILLQSENTYIYNVMLPMPGDYNVSNSLAAVAVARHLGMNAKQIRKGLFLFKGVKRRFTLVGEINGVTIIDDYAHHPVEISAVLSAARQATKGKVIAVHEPHRYSRLDSLFEDFCNSFNDADIVGITEVYSAGEKPIKNRNRDSLVAGLKARGHRNAFAVKDEEDLKSFFAKNCNEGDLLVCLGAGTISAWAYGLSDNIIS